MKPGRVAQAGAVATPAAVMRKPMEVMARTLARRGAVASGDVYGGGPGAGAGIHLAVYFVGHFDAPRCLQIGREWAGLDASWGGELGLWVGLVETTADSLRE